MSNLFLGLKSDQWTALSSIGTLAAVFVALFLAVLQDKLKGLFFRPRLAVSIEMMPPFCQKVLTTNGTDTAPCYYFRIKVENNGSRDAENVEVLAADLLEADQEGNYKRNTRFLPMRLRWSHDQRLGQTISAGMFRFCDIGHIIDPKFRTKFVAEDFIVTFADIFLHHEIAEEVIFSFDTEERPLTSSHLIACGRYRLILIIGEKDYETKRVEIDMVIGKEWHANQDKMLGEGISLKIEGSPASPLSNESANTKKASKKDKPKKVAKSRATSKRKRA